MLQLSDIQSSQEEMQDYYAQLRALHVTPAWIGAGISIEPQSQGTNYHVVEGTGYSVIGDQRLDWEDKDVFTVPTWTFREHVNSGDSPAFLSSFSDAPVMQALSLYREQTRP